MCVSGSKSFRNHPYPKFRYVYVMQNNVINGVLWHIMTEYDRKREKMKKKEKKREKTAKNDKK